MAAWTLEAPSTLAVTSIVTLLAETDIPTAIGGLRPPATAAAPATALMVLELVAWTFSPLAATTVPLGTRRWSILLSGRARPQLFG